MTLHQPNFSSVSWSDLPPAAKAGAKHLCETSHLYFTRLFFKEMQGAPMLVGAHHKVMAKAIDRVFAGEIDRLLITVPPGYTKTEEAVIALIARGLAINPRARFIHASFSAELVNENSVRIKDVVSSEPYQDMWPIAFKADQDAKGLWRTTERGGLLAKPAGGPITGFRAGLMEDGFTGALVLDDALKPDDAFSDLKRGKINGRYHSTFKSRLAHERVPIIVIMQRLHVEDFAGFLLTGGAGCKWHHLWLPVRIDNSMPYPGEWTHGIPIEHGLPDGPLWEAKHNAQQVKELEGADADANYVFMSQYMQMPTILGGNLFKDKWLTEYETLPPLLWRAVYGDTAQKVKQKSDFTHFAEWGAGIDGKAYLLDHVHGKFEAPELVATADAFWTKCRARPTNTHGILRAFKIEDKVSGTGLIQHLSRKGIPVLPIERAIDKYQRALDVLPSFAAGLVLINEDLPNLAGFKREMLMFTGQGDTKDDMVDTTIDAVADICGGGIDMAAWA